MTNMRPRVIVHTAVSLDGRTDRIIGDVGLYYEVAAQLRPDATLTGANTLLGSGLSDDAEDLEPLMDKEGRQLLVVTDSRGRVRCWRKLQNQPYWGDVMVLCSESTPSEYLAYLRKVGVGLIKTPGDKVDLAFALEALCSDHGVRTVRVDSGGALASALIDAGLVDELLIMVYPHIVGGTSSHRFYLGDEPTDDRDIMRLKMVRSQRLRGGVELLCYHMVR